MQPAEPRPVRPVVAAVSLAALAAAVVLALVPVGTPPVSGADAPPGEFSAARAYAHVREVGARPHVSGSDANARVADHLVAALEDAGARTEVPQAVGVTHDDAHGYAAAPTRNVVGVLPGTDPTGRVFLVAHYDSVQTGPGGNDDGAGAATVVETMRALANGPRPRNDVVAVLTDAEEACLCGAEAFASQHPLAEDGGVVLNLEARGTTGPPVMFETSAGNADLAALFGDAAPHPVGTSMAVEVYRVLPNDTDFSVFLDHEAAGDGPGEGGFTGLNSAYIDGSAAYHTPQDTPVSMDRRSLQAHGDNTLALTRALAGRDLGAVAAPSGGDATYFPVPGGLVRYPGWLVWPLAALAGLAVLGVAARARRRGCTSWPRTAAGAGLALLPLVGAALAAQGMWALLVALRPGYAPMTDPWHPGWFRLTLVALAVTVTLGWFAALRRRVGAVPLVLGGLTWLAVLGVALATAAPGGSYLTALPALAGALATAVALPRSEADAAGVPDGAGRIRPGGRADDGRRAGAATLAGAVGAVVLAPTVLLFLPALGLATGGAPAFLTAALVLAWLPLLVLLPAPRVRGRRPSPATLGTATAALVALACLAGGLVVDGFGPDRPRPSHLAYVEDADTGTARWVSAETDPGTWTARHAGTAVPGAAGGSGGTGASAGDASVDGTGEVMRALTDGSLPVLAGDVAATGRAPAAGTPPPTVRTVADSAEGGGEDTVADGRRTLTLRLVPQRPVRLASLAVTDGPEVVGATVEGRDVPLASPDDAGATDRTADRDATDGEEPFALTVHAVPDDGVTVRLVLDGTGPVTLRAADGSDGLAGLPGYTPRPDDVGPLGSHTADLRLVSRTVRVP